jgi:hypothetical protein
VIWALAMEAMPAAATIEAMMFFTNDSSKQLEGCVMHP